jgi:hypothetical protein
MTTSNEYRLDLTLNDVIFEAYDLLQVAADGETIVGGLFNRARDSVNIMLKLWESQGIHLWTMTEGSLFLQVERDKNDFRLEGFEALTADASVVHLANEFVQRTITADVAVSTLLLPMEDVTNLTVGSQIGAINGDNDLDWYVVMEITGLNVTLSRPTDNALSSGTVIYSYDYFNFSTLTAPELLGATVLDVVDTTIYNVGDSVLIHLTNNSTDERIISAVNQGANTITITVGLTDAAGVGEEVVNITTRLQPAFKPVKRILNDNVRRRESTNYEIPIVFQSRKDYFDLPNKNQPGTPIQAYYDRQIPQGVMYLWNSPSSAVSIINFTYERKIQVMTEATQTFDLPEDWYDAITYNLAKRLISKVGCSQERKADIVSAAQEYLDNALAFDQAVYPIRLKPQRYG